ncbi:hypothetical protein JFL43_21215 [Viridibacillus sp. YIM B01967]|uniref:Transposase n=1 Tax=Viridibacillus soli TaxID=2798301 RepID=A0ABS1HD96_9BACL|nr:hypothetical protein [Viridibacillus soli]
MIKGFSLQDVKESNKRHNGALRGMCKELLDKYFAGELARQLSVSITNLEAEQSIQSKRDQQCQV